jgi:hypothetical protein
MSSHGKRPAQHVSSSRVRCADLRLGRGFNFEFVFDLICRLQFGATDQLSALGFEVES